MEIKLVRFLFDDYYTEGYLFVDGEPFGHTIEDKVRLDGEKIYGQTAIPKGEYRVILDKSQRFQKVLPRILDVPGFQGVLIHGGNTANDSLGCILVAKKKIGPGIIQGNITNELVDKLSKAKNEIKISILEAK